VLDEQHIRTLRAFGTPERRIVFKYALKLACIPTLAIIGVGIGELLGGAVFVEIIFNRPGLGSLIFDAIRDRNYPIVQGGVLLVVTLFVLTNLLVDLSYAWLDPRLRETLAAPAG
jgi:peptide/nickel transport system permease protein